VRIIGFLILSLCIVGASRAGDAVRVGKGSYALAAPPGLKLAPRTICRAPSFRGPMPTNGWWSSLAWERFSSNHFPHPLAMRAEAGGLRVSYPGAEIHATPKHVFAGLKDELVLGHSASAAFPDARVEAASDWFVRVLFADGGRTMRVSYGHGSPFVYALFEGGAAAVRFDAEPKVWSGDAKAATLGVTVKARHYALFGPTGSTWSGLGTRAFTNHNGGKRHFSLALLPDDRPATLALFARYAHSHVVDTRVAWRYEPATSTVETTFTFATRAHEGAERGTLFALYPHQWMATKHSLLPQTYASIRGPMRLAAGDRFATTMRFPGVLPALPDVGACDRARLGGYLAEAAAKPPADPPDTYWQGKALGALASLVPIAEQAAKPEVAERLRDVLRARLETWLAAPGAPPKSERYFLYDPVWGALIGVRPSYGSADQLNDHHFHYGYFIRAAAELARADRTWAAPDAWGGMVRLLIRDIASPERSDELFPFLRCFDPYAGHSWASGHARFGDGNNQESCSEAMNAWTALILWGAATGDRAIRDLGIALYTTELHAIQAYWFDIHRRVFPETYAQTCAALIWGGKFDYATWFSGEPEHVHGIILLPIQSGSLYLGLYPDAVRRNLSGLARLRGSDEWKHWHDTLWMYEALADPDRALRRFDAGTGRIDPLARPHVYHWIATLQAVGQVDRSVTADHPLYAVFRKGDQRTYVACRMGETPRAVAFSDGFRLALERRGLAVGTRRVP